MDLHQHQCLDPDPDPEHRPAYGSRPGPGPAPCLDPDLWTLNLDKHHDLDLGLHMVQRQCQDIDLWTLNQHLDLGLDHGFCSVFTPGRFHLCEGWSRQELTAGQSGLLGLAVRRRTPARPLTAASRGRLRLQ